MSVKGISAHEYNGLASVARRISPGGDVDQLHDAWLEIQNGSRRNLMARTKFRALDERRRLSRLSPLPLEEQLPSQCNDGPIDKVILAEQRAMVRREIDQLATRDRDVIVYRWFDGLSVSEIAHRLGMPVKTIYSRLTRAEEKLRTKLQPCGDGA